MKEQTASYPRKYISWIDPDESYFLNGNWDKIMWPSQIEFKNIVIYAWMI